MRYSSLTRVVYFFALLWLHSANLSASADECYPSRSGQIDIPPPGMELITGIHKSACNINLIYSKPAVIKGATSEQVKNLLRTVGIPGPFSIESIDLSERSEASLSSLLDVVGMTATGKSLLSFARPKLQSGELKIKPMPKSMLENFRLQFGNVSRPTGSYLHSKKTYYFNIDGLGNFAQFLTTTVHELTHARRAWSQHQSSECEELDSEEEAYTQADQFFEELARLVPCIRDVMPDFPRRLTRREIAALYRISDCSNSVSSQ